MLALFLLAACLSRPPTRHGPDPPPGDDSGPPADTEGGTDTADTGPDPGPCPAGMAVVDGRFCIDRYEAGLQTWDGATWVARSPYRVLDTGERVRATVAPGAIPQAYLSGDEAEGACLEAGKRLCTSEEWLAACQGPQGWIWPYGDTYQAGACNDDYPGTHPVVDYFGTSEGVWDSAHMNDPGIDQQPGTVAPGGQFTACRSAWGACDLHGNLHEWVADADGTFRGGFFADASINGPGCTYVTTAHERGYHDYSTGFRCCAEPA